MDWACRRRPAARVHNCLLARGTLAGRLSLPCPRIQNPNNHANLNVPNLPVETSTLETPRPRSSRTPWPARADSSLAPEPAGRCYCATQAPIRPAGQCGRKQASTARARRRQVPVHVRALLVASSVDAWVRARTPGQWGSLAPALLAQAAIKRRNRTEQGRATRRVARAVAPHAAGREAWAEDRKGRGGWGAVLVDHAHEARAR